tara:strand:+ start:19 stop:1884 length:1866 start_codon:yes stop_codon:yes gene_type:complete
MAMTVQEAYSILNKLHGYTGPQSKRAISNFINARDIPIAVKNRGGMIGMSTGGGVDDRIPPDSSLLKKLDNKGNEPKDEPYTVEDVEEGQAKLVGDVFTDPSKATKKTTVDKIKTPTTTTGLIDDTSDKIQQKDPTDATFTKVSATDTATVPGTTSVEDSTFVAADTDVKKETQGVTTQKIDDADVKEVTGQEKDTTKVSDLDSAKIDTAQTVKDAPTRKAETGEMIDETPVVDQARVKEAEAKAASVKDELTTLMSEFDDGQTPAWAAGSMRKAMQTLAARGLGSSSLAGQAVIQAAMEAALPIAQVDAANKQQVALANAEQRAKFLQIEFDNAFKTKVMNAAKVSEIANMNFTADQQIALENAKMAQTVDIANLSNSQALIMAEAAQLSQLELSSLSNMQQAQVENAKNFLQVDMANLNTAQQTEIFKAQQNINAILTDAASENASNQFNAKSQNQSSQFDQSLQASVNQFNANQKNAIKMFNAKEDGANSQFNQNQKNIRNQFNAQNHLIIAQANAKWRQDIATINSATQNQANFQFAKDVNGLTNKAIDTLWQRERDLMSFAFTSSEAALDRALKIVLGDKTLEGIRQQVDATEGAAKANLFARLFFGNKGLFGDDD